VTRYENVFVLPLLPDRYLLHAPLSRLSAVINHEALVQLRNYLQAQKAPSDPALYTLYNHLVTPELDSPLPRDGPLNAPCFLGLIPTRSCNMACVYCDFATLRGQDVTMSYSLARAAIDAYLQLLERNAYAKTPIHFFGGEPFFAFDLVQFAVDYARQQANRLNRRIHFEATTNGLYPSTRTRWIAANFDTVVLSLDGPPEVLDSQRPGLNGRSVASQIIANARIFAASNIDLILRVCVTGESVAQLQEIAIWMAESFNPVAICFETLTPTALSLASGFHPPDPWEFSSQFLQAAKYLESQGINTIFSTAEIDNLDDSFCPVGKDALIVSPNGSVNACYQLETAWQSAGLDMRLGLVDEKEGCFIIDQAQIEKVRKINVYMHSQCQRCFCRWHCAGGCHLNLRSEKNGAYSDTCIQTRLTSAFRILRELEQDFLSQALMENKSAQLEMVWQKDDRLIA